MTHGNSEERVQTVVLDHIFELTQVALNRAYIFSALSEKVKSMEIASIDLNRGYTFGLIPQEIWEQNQSEYKDAFQVWVASNCIEDIVESFDKMLVDLYELIPVSDNAPSKLQKHNFNEHPLKDKLKSLQRFEIEIDHVDCLKTLTSVRNCLTHGQGVVSDEDVRKAGNNFHLKWYYPKATMVGKLNGMDHGIVMDGGPINTLQFDPTDELTCVLENDFKVKKYKKGDAIELEAYEIQEICYSATLSLESLYRNFALKMKEWGAVITH